MAQSGNSKADMAAPMLDDTVLRDLIGYRLKRAYMQVQPAAQKVLADDRLRLVSFSCLSMIADNPGIVQMQLATALQMERSNLVLVIDELEERGLITRTKVPTDRRRSALNATLRGRRLRDRAAARVKAAEDAIIGRLDAADRDLLLATLTALEDRATRGN